MTIPVAGAALLILYANEKTLARRLLSLSPLVWVGLISYSAYLWHQPILAFIKNNNALEHSAAALYTAVAITLPLAWLTWKFVEQPFRNKKRIGRKAIFTSSLAGMVIMVGLGVVIITNFTRIESHWLSRQTPTTAQTYMLINGTNEGDDWKFEGGVQQDGECRFNVRDLTEAQKSQLLLCYDKFGAGTLLFGDSHSVDSWGVLASRVDAPFLIGVTQNSCRLDSPKPNCQFDNLLGFLALNPDVFDHVFYEQAGYHLMLDQQGNKGTGRILSGLALDDIVEGLSIDTARVLRAADALTAYAQHVPVTWLGPRIEPHIADRQILAKGCDGTFTLRSGTTDIFETLERDIAKAVKATGVSTLYFQSQNEAIGYRFPGDFMTCDAIYWSDKDHLSAAGEVYFGKRLADDFVLPPTSN